MLLLYEYMTAARVLSLVNISGSHAMHAYLCLLRIIPLLWSQRFLQAPSKLIVRGKEA
jgi:hypothetical protein